MQFKVFFQDIKIAHTVFALPFALMAALLATISGLPSTKEMTLIVLAMFGARTWAMCVNRLADAAFDKDNPRTTTRALPAGKISTHYMALMAAFGALLFIVAAGCLSQTALLCSIPVLVILGAYSYTKRFTWLCHYWLGLSLGLAPVGAWVALRGSIHSGPVLLGFAIMFWVSSFDILYALQDLEFDIKKGLNSVPARFGETKALLLARIGHMMAFVFFLLAGLRFDLGYFYAAGLALAVLLLAWQHLAISKRGTSAIPFAFFNLNAWVAVILFLSTLFDKLYALSRANLFQI